MKKTGAIFLILWMLVGCASSSEVDVVKSQETPPLTDEKAFDLFLDVYQDWHVRYFSYDHELEAYTLHGHLDGVEVIVSINKNTGILEERVVRDLKNYRDETDITHDMISDISKISTEPQSFELYKQQDVYVLNLIEKGLSYNINTQESLDD